MRRQLAARGPRDPSSSPSCVGVAVPAGGHRRRPARLRRQGRRLADRARRRRRRLVADRPVVRRATEYFHPRPSAAGDGYDGAASAASNLGPTNPDSPRRRSSERVAAYREENGSAADAPVPVDAVTASGSGLDPHISVANARLQAPRSPQARGLRSRRRAGARRRAHRRRDARLPRRAGVNVLELNLALDAERLNRVTLSADGPRHAPHLPRRRARRRQDVRHAQRGPPPRASGHRRRRRLRRDPRPAERPREQIGDLEVVPRRRASSTAARRSRRWTSTRSCARRPQVVLVDELAHTNVPGSRNEKRWQDVEELLDAGHRRHLDASTSSTSSRSTTSSSASPGSRSARRSPTRSSARADQIELVDMSPEALRRRMAHGNIYRRRADRRRARQLLPAGQPRRAPRARAAVGRRPGRRRARRVPRRHGIDRPWETRERVRRRAHRRADGDRLIRRAARMAAARARASCSASTSRPQDGLAGPTAATRSTSQRRAARGARRRRTTRSSATTSRRRSSTRPAAERHPARARREPPLALARSCVSGSVISRVIRDSGAESTSTSSATRAPAPTSAPRAPARPAGAAAASARGRAGWLAAVGLPLLTVVLAQLREPPRAAERAAALPARSWSSSSAIGGIWPALVAAVGGFLLVNWFFTPPLHTLTIAEGENLLALVVFLVVAGVVSGLVDRAARRVRARASARAPRPRRSPGSPGTSTADDPLPRAVDQLATLRARRASRCSHRHERRAGASRPRPASAGAERADDGRRGRRRRRRTCSRSPGRRLAAGRPAGARRVRRPARRLEPDERARGRGRRGRRPRRGQRAARRAARGRVARPAHAARRHQGVGHQPASATTSTGPPDERDEFLATIEDETDRLDRARRQPARHEPAPGRRAAASSPRRSGSTRSCRRARQPRRRARPTVDVDVPETLPARRRRRRRCSSGRRQPRRQRARPRSPAERPSASRRGAVDGGVDLRVVDRGPGIPAADRERVFQPFQRLGDRPQRRRRRARAGGRPRLRRGDGRRARGRRHARRRHSPMVVAAARRAA